MRYSASPLFFGFQSGTSFPALGGVPDDVQAAGKSRP
jgi:hypothetical protein